MKKKYFNSERLLSFAAILLSVCTLIVFVYQTRLIQKQQYASVYPHLQIGNHGTGNINYKYILSNDGVGPALLKTIRVIDSTGKVYNDLKPYVSANIKKSDSISFTYSNLIVGMIIPAGKSIEVISFNGSKIKGANKLSEILNQKDLVIEVEYKSIYNESWKISNRSYIPELID
ncbi:hypothetical protein [Aquimarina sp. 2201CG5-10]|uniref:hypothetical protein n=1 Tax=Aquimarina callyspongiae TaxID=3098150 RepID=UPI002AB56FA4|nr:hypothetical protein [Aquimarina sp. 2201CG5-10]MDY8137962.1 hypothetical protein [Aquimarina sp. 2201CG5-10]